MQCKAAPFCSFMDLQQIIQGCIEQDRICQKHLFDHCYHYGMKVTLAYCKDPEEAREVLNDSFVKLFSNLNNYNLDKPLFPWFRTIIIRTAINFYQNNKNNIVFSELPEDLNISSGKGENILFQLEADEILRLTNQLPPSYRLVLNLYALEGYSHHEIAGMLHISEGTSKSNLSKARAFLIKLISNSKLLIFF